MTVPATGFCLVCLLSLPLAAFSETQAEAEIEQETEQGVEQNADQAETGSAAQANDASETTEDQAPTVRFRPFTPSEEISADNVVPFPVDI